MAKPRSGTKKATHNPSGVPRRTFTPEQTAAGTAAAAAKVRLEHLEPVILQVRDIEHAKSEEVLKFCLSQLQAGISYNALRIKLGLGPAYQDYRWRLIRQLLSEMILPANEDEALMSANALGAYLLKRMEEFADKASARALEMRGDKNEFQFLKLELDAMKILTEKYEAQTDHYLKMKDLQKQEKGRHGQTVVFNNMFHIARPGDALKEVGPKLEEAAQLVARMEDLNNE